MEPQQTTDPHWCPKKIQSVRIHAGEYYSEGEITMKINYSSSCWRPRGALLVKTRCSWSPGSVSPAAIIQQKALCLLHNVIKSPKPNIMIIFWQPLRRLQKPSGRHISTASANTVSRYFITKHEPVSKQLRSRYGLRPHVGVLICRDMRRGL